MSSPGPVEPAAPPDSWNMDISHSEGNNAHLSDGPENATHHENGDTGGDPNQSGDILLQPSTTAGGPDLGVPGAQTGTIYREKQIKPNKVYVGGLPEHTRQEDLQSCFGKIGQITSIELKLGFGFVEFADREAAEESVAKYHEGYFMGNKIRVELSHGGGRTAKFSGEPGACFKCGQMGHWARECPNHVVTVGNRKSEATLMDRVSHPPRDYGHPSRDYASYRDDYRASHPPPVRDARYGYDYPPPTRDQRDYRAPRDVRPLTPPRDYREYPAGPPPPRASRDVDDYRRDYRGPPPPPPPASRYDSRPGYYHEVDYPRGGYAPPQRDPYDARGGYDRRPPVPHDRYPPYPPPVTGGRPRTPPRGRDDYEKLPPRDYPPPEYRGRPTTPPASARFSDNARSNGPDGGNARYRRRSQSPISRSGPPYHSGPPQPPASYSHGPPYPPPSGSFAGGYPLGAPGPIPGRPPNVSGGHRDRDYTPRAGRDTGDPGPYGRRP